MLAGSQFVTSDAYIGAVCLCGGVAKDMTGKNAAFFNARVPFYIANSIGTAYSCDAFGNDETFENVFCVKF